MPNIYIKRKQFEITDTLLEDDTHSTYLVKRGEKNFVIKSFVTKDLFDNELKQHKKLTKCGIKVPKLLKTDKVRLLILYEYIEGENMLQVISKEDISDQVFDGLFLIYRFARFSKIDLNYLPENYIFYKKDLYYMSHEVGIQNPKTNLENYGMKYWVYTRECAQHLKEKGFEVDKNRILGNAEANKKIVLLSILRW